MKTNKKTKKTKTKFETETLQSNQIPTQEEIQRDLVFKNIDKKKEKENLKVFECDMFNHYFLINQFIEKEIYLENSNLSDDVDSTIRHFNQIFVMYMALTLFGMLFPMSFFLYYFALIMEIYIDRQEYLYISRRPTPKEMNSIGFFKYFLIICPNLSMITISYYLSFALLRITLNINYIYTAFLSIFVCGVLIHQAVYAINPKGTEKMKHLIERQEYIGKFGVSLISS